MRPRPMYNVYLFLQQLKKKKKKKKKTFLGNVLRERPFDFYVDVDFQDPVMPEIYPGPGSSIGKLYR